MKAVRVSTRSKSIRALLDKARKQDIIVQAPDGSEFMVTAIDDFDREIAATRRNKKLMAYLHECARETELIPLEEVRRGLGLAARPGTAGSKPARKAKR
jgi:hypothetical protein